MFDQNFIDEVKGKSSCIIVAEMLGHTVRKNVTNCLKPENHKNQDKSPSLVLGREGFKCMVASCGVKGDVFEFVKIKMGVDFNAAVTFVASAFGVPIPALKSIPNKSVKTDVSNKTQDKAKDNGQVKSVKSVELFELKEVPNYAKFCEEAHIKLLDNPKALEYLRSRGITHNTIASCFLGLDGDMIVVPYIVNSKIVYYSARSMTERRFYQPAGTVPCPIGVDNLKKGRKIYLAEGLFDYLTCIEQGKLAIGVPGTNAWKHSKEWNSLLLGNKIMLCGHADESGIPFNKFMSELCSGLSLPYEMPDWSVTNQKDIAIKDLNEWHIRGGKIDEIFHEETKYTLGEIKDAFMELVDLTDYPDSVDLVISVIISNIMQGDPVWILLVGPPSVGKTEIIRSCNNAISTYYINRISPNTLISGWTKVEGSDVISRIVKPTTFCVTDFGSFLSFHPQDMQKIMQQFRDIYDGKVRVEYGNGKIINWSGKIGMLGGITPEIERHTAFIGRLGDRFLYYRMEISKGRRQSIAVNALLNESNEEDQRRKISHIVSRFVDDCAERIKEAERVEIDHAMAVKIAYCVDFLTRARTSVARMKDMQKTIEYKPEFEMTGRVARAFKVLVKALAFVRGKTKVDEEDYKVLLGIAHGSIPSIRLDFLRSAYLKRTEWLITSEFGQMLGKDTESARYHLKNLLAVGIFDIETTAKSHRWKMRDDAVSLIEGSQFFEQ